MKKYYVCLMLCLATIGLGAQGLDFQWVNSASGSGLINSNSITTDAAGYVYTTGRAWGSLVDLHTQSGIHSLPSQGGYVQKLDVDGHFVWGKSIGGNGNSVATDSQGNVYVCGTFSGIKDFDPGLGVNNVVSAGGNDMFILKLNPNGDFVWVNQFGGALDDSGSEIVVDLNNDLCITGTFSDVVDFDPGTGVYNLTSNGARDHYVLKLDSNGAFIWANGIGGSDIDGGASIITDLNGNVYTTGSFANTVDFDPGLGVSNLTSNGAGDIFIQKLDPNGNYIWAKSMGGWTFDGGQHIDIDASGNVYSTGYYKNATGAGGVDFDPDPSGTFLLNSVGGQSDMYIQKLDSNGSFIWAKSIGGNSNDAGFSIVLDGQNEVYLTGKFGDTVDFDPGVGVYNMIGVSNHSDCFVLNLDSNGEFLWGESFGAAGYDIGASIAIANCSDVYVTGNFSDTVDFNTGSGVNELLSAGSLDAFLVKLSAEAFGVDTVSSCGAYTWIDGNTYTTDNNTAEYTIPGGAASGCDSSVVLNLTIEELGTPQFELAYEPYCEGVLVQVTSDQQLNNAAFNWQLQDGQTSQEAHPTFDVMFGSENHLQLSVNNGAGCSGDKDSTFLVGNFEDYFNIESPNVFTPNNDGVNDVFSIVVEDRLIECMSINIYNRWGQEVYSTNSKGNINWDGYTYAGNPVPDGTYFYLLKVGETEYQGAISLQR